MNLKDAKRKAEQKKKQKNFVIDKLKQYLKQISVILSSAKEKYKSKRTMSGRNKRKIILYFNLTFIPFVFLYYEILFKIFGKISIGSVFSMVFMALATGFVFQSIFLLLPKMKWRFIFSEIIVVFVGIFFIVECFVGKAFQVFMTLGSLLTGAGDTADDFGSVIVHTIISGWYTILLFLLPAIVLFVLYRNNYFRFRRKVYMIKKIPLYALVCFLLGTLFSVFNPVYAKEYQYDMAVRRLGVISSFYADARQNLFGGKSGFASVETDEEIETNYDPNTMDIDFAAISETAKNSDIAELDSYLATQKGTLQNEYTGLFKGKNLILITAEAFSHYAVREDLTPTLYRMMHNGFYFSDFYQPAWGGSTSTGEYSVLMGTVPTDGVESMKETQGHNLYLTIGNQHLRAGYHTAAYHNNSHTYYDRNLTHENFGYKTFTGMGNGMEEGVTNCWPQSDKEMLDFTVPQYIDKQPFSIYYMSVSGHCAYSTSSNSMSKKNWDAVQEIEASDTVKAYYASQLELEYAMKSLITQLETAEILDDTVICISSDHYPYGLEEGETWHNDKNYLPELYGCSEAETEDKFIRDRNACIIWSGCLENELKDYAKEISEPVYSLDILPTLSNLFGLEYDSRLLVGRDVFSTEEPLVIWGDYSFKTADAFYDSRSGNVTPVKEGAEVSDEYISSMKKIVGNKMNLSKITLHEDYWEHVFGAMETTESE